MAESSADLGKRRVTFGDMKMIGGLIIGLVVLIVPVVTAFNNTASKTDVEKVEASASVADGKRVETDLKVAANTAAVTAIVEMHKETRNEIRYIRARIDMQIEAQADESPRKRRAMRRAAGAVSARAKARGHADPLEGLSGL